MVNLIDGLIDCLGTEFCIALGEYRFLVVSDRACYIEGIRAVRSITEQEIVMSVKGASLSVSGSDLKIVSVDGQTAAVTGRRLKVECIGEKA